MKAKEGAHFVNTVQGVTFEERNLEQILDIVGLPVDKSLYSNPALRTKNNNYGRIANDSYLFALPYEDIVPRVEPKHFLDQSNGYAVFQNLNVSSGIAVQQIIGNGEEYTKYNVLFTPLDTLTATMMRRGRVGIRKMLGEGIDTLTADDILMIDEIDKYFFTSSQLEYLREKKKEANDSVSEVILGDVIRANAHMERKRYNNMIDPKKIDDSTFCGFGYNANVPSKVEGQYVVTGKHFVHWKNYLTANGMLQLPYVPIAFDLSCNCGKFLFSKTKYEHNKVVYMCHHLELNRQTFSDPTFGGDIKLVDGPNGKKMNNIDSLFTPFNLDNPEAGTPNLRTVLRKVLYATFVPQDSIKEDFNDKKGRNKSNGYTLFGVEANAALLVCREIYSPRFMQLMNSFYDNDLSMKNTGLRGFSTFTATKDFDIVDATHVVNAENQKLEHHVDGHYYFVDHAVKDRNTNHVLLNPKGEALKLAFNQLSHNNLTHVRVDPQLRSSPNLEIVHISPVYKEFTNFDAPFKYAVLPNKVTVYPMNYKMKKVK